MLEVGTGGAFSTVHILKKVKQLAGQSGVIEGSE